jgi:hypothetical protein
MATPYQINITMDQPTVEALTAGGYWLYGFKGVQTSLQGGAPLVWIQSKTYSLDTVVTWKEQYQAYTSKSEIKDSRQILASAEYNIDLQQTLNVTDVSGTGQVVTGGTTNAISITNQTSTQFTCGISQIQNASDKATPLCAFQLYGKQMDVMAPIELVMLEFATSAFNTGTVIYQAFSPGVLINLTTQSTVGVTYDINNGWSASGNPNVSFLPPGTDIRPLLLTA